MTNPRLKPEVKTAWLDALRSGDYEQGTGYLRHPVDGRQRHCCLGVLCEVAVKAGLDITVRPDYPIIGDGERTSFDGETVYLPASVIDWAFDPRDDLPGGEVEVEYEDEDYHLHTAELVGLNDGGMSFEQIADIIERTL